MFHSCGMVRPLIPDLIGLGVDELDPIQLTGPEMQSEDLKRDFGDRLTFHGGIDMQACCLTPPRPKSKRKRGAIVKWRAPAAATSLRRHICFSPTCRPRISWLSIVARPSIASLECMA